MEFKEDSVLNYICEESFFAIFTAPIECKCENVTDSLTWSCPLTEYGVPVCMAGPGKRLVKGLSYNLD